MLQDIELRVFLETFLNVKIITLYHEQLYIYIKIFYRSENTNNRCSLKHFTEVKMANTADDILRLAILKGGRRKYTCYGN